jgi:hypothetical protein
MSWSALAAWLALEAIERAICSSPLLYCRMDTSSPLLPGRTCGTCSVGATVVLSLVDVVAARVGWRGGCLDVWIAGSKGSNCGWFFFARFAGGGCGIGGMSVEDWALVDTLILAKTPPRANFLRKRLFMAAERLPSGGTREASGCAVLAVLSEL